MVYLLEYIQFVTLQFVTLQFVTLQFVTSTIRDIIIDLRINIIVLNLSYFMLCDDCQIATYVYTFIYTTIIVITDDR